MDSNRIVCSYGSGLYYSRGVKRLAESCRAFDQQFIDMTNSCPTLHEEVPYKFKVEALQFVTPQARLWLDSPCRFIKDPAPLWEQLARDGYLLLDSGYTVGPWSSDRSLQYFGVKRDEVFDLPMPMGACWGYDVRKESGRTFREFMERYAEAKTPFLGSLWNRNNSESDDPRVQGHRMDMVVMAFIARREGFKITKTPHFWACYEQYVTPDTVIYSEGIQ